MVYKFYRKILLPCNLSWMSEITISPIGDSHPDLWNSIDKKYWARVYSAWTYMKNTIEWRIRTFVFPLSTPVPYLCQGFFLFISSQLLFHFHPFQFMFLFFSLLFSFPINYHSNQILFSLAYPTHSFPPSSLSHSPSFH